MNRYRVIFIDNKFLDDRFAEFIEEFIELSGYYSVIERKDSDDKNIWDEIVDSDNRAYLIECQMTNVEYELLSKNWTIERI